MPQLPVITVVTPWLILHSINGLLSSARSSWVWVSTNPGASARPLAAISRAPFNAARSPIATMRSSLTARSPRTPGLPLPSISNASRMMRSGWAVVSGGMGTPGRERDSRRLLKTLRVIPGRREAARPGMTSRVFQSRPGRRLPLLRPGNLRGGDHGLPLHDVGLDALADRLGRAGLRVDALNGQRLLNVRRGHGCQYGG